MHRNDSNFGVLRLLLESYVQERVNNRKFVQTVLQYVNEVQARPYLEISKRDVMERLLTISTDEHQSSGLVSNTEAMELWQCISKSVIGVLKDGENQLGISSGSRTTDLIQGNTILQTGFGYQNPGTSQFGAIGNASFLNDLKVFLASNVQARANKRTFVQDILQYANEVQARSNLHIPKGDVIDKLLTICTSDYQTSGFLSNHEATVLWQSINNSVVLVLKTAKEKYGVPIATRGTDPVQRNTVIQAGFGNQNPGSSSSGAFGDVAFVQPNCSAVQGQPYDPATNSNISLGTGIPNVQLPGPPQQAPIIPTKYALLPVLTYEYVQIFDTCVGYSNNEPTPSGGSIAASITGTNAVTLELQDMNGNEERADQINMDSVEELDETTVREITENSEETIGNSQENDDEHMRVDDDSDEDFVNSPESAEGSSEESLGEDSEVIDENNEATRIINSQVRDQSVGLEIGNWLSRNGILNNDLMEPGQENNIQGLGHTNQMGDPDHVNEIGDPGEIVTNTYGVAHGITEPTQINLGVRDELWGIRIEENEVIDDGLGVINDDLSENWELEMAENNSHIYPLEDVINFL